MKRLDLVLCLMLLGAPACADDSASYRHGASIDFAPGPAFVRLPLPASAYALSRQPGLRDLRIVDARGQRVPFAILPPRGDMATAREVLRPAILYPLPAGPTADGSWNIPLEVSVDGQRVIVKRSERRAAAEERSAGWLFDIGETRPEEPAPHALRLAWSGPAEFSASFSVETSDDLRAWQPGGAGQLLALSGDRGPITQPLVALPPVAGRFAKLVWSDPVNAPKLLGAQVLRRQASTRSRDELTEINVGGAALPPLTRAEDRATESGRALYFDLGGDLPLADLDLRLDADTQVVPARIEALAQGDKTWHVIASTVFYRLHHGAEVVQAPPLDIDVQARYLRILVDPRAAPLDPAHSSLVVRSRLASLLFAAQGTTPFTLHAGSDDAQQGALPIATLVPNLDAERPKFGLAKLGAWRENPEAARQDAIEARQATLRHIVLWGVLVAGVAMLGYMVWRQTKGRSDG
jgi:hypothetical protein